MIQNIFILPSICQFCVRKVCVYVYHVYIFDFESQIEGKIKTFGIIQTLKEFYLSILKYLIFSFYINGGWQEVYCFPDSCFLFFIFFR